MEKIFHTADALIIGGGAAGLFAAIRLSEINPRAKIIIVDKADIRRNDNATHVLENSANRKESVVI